ncbi:MAG: ParB/RepB/Spo0J family partition protein, partial [Planctomycetes bacterium]|nr:ParB/RepB/Spo0J family partition protein [Planctomycetota bacterium]
MSKKGLGSNPLLKPFNQEDVKVDLQKVSEIVLLPRETIRLNPNNRYKSGIHPNNPRIQELTRSIENNGILQDVWVRILTPEAVETSEGIKYEIIDGNRRFFASGLIHPPLPLIQCRIVEIE